jgi:hypothetical protein
MKIHFQCTRARLKTATIPWQVRRLQQEVILQLDGNGSGKPENRNCLGDGLGLPALVHFNELTEGYNIITMTQAAGILSLNQVI